MKIIKKVYKDKKSFTISRKNWARGGKNGSSALLNENNNMCCLGFQAKSCGFTDDQIVHLPDPETLFNQCKPDLNKVWLANYTQSDVQIAEWNTKLIDNAFDGSNSLIAFDLMSINDSIDLSESERESQITMIFNKIGIKVKFVD